MIDSHPTKLNGVRVIRGVNIFKDFRGKYRELYSKNDYMCNEVDMEFVSHTFSLSYKNVLRGIHGDQSNWKLISCILGSFYLVVVNFVPDSDQFCQWESFILTEDENTQILVPPRFGNGHLILSDKAIFHYLQSNYYVGQQNQFTLKWNDPKLNINWPIKGQPILSKRDEEAQYVK